VLLIHFLQRKAKVVPVSTLFLLEKTMRESMSGRRFDRLMNSVPLWMQLFAVLLLTWLLVEPRYAKPRSVQRIAVVLDASASMEPFRDRLATELEKQLPDLLGLASVAELTLFESTPGGQRLYAGESAVELVAALRDWRPREGTTDPTHALRLARSLVSRDGLVVYATDTPLERLPFDALLLAVGEPIANAGFTGVTVERTEGAMVWQALLRNYSDRTLDRSWSVEFPDGSRTEPKPVTLDPGALVSLQSAFPAGVEQLVVRVNGDEFPLDDALPLVTPEPKPLLVFAPSARGASGDFANRLLNSLEAARSVDDSSTADLSVIRYDPLSPVMPSGNALVFVRDDTSGGEYLKGGIVAEKHALTDALNWQPLLARETIQLERRPEDQVLLWQGTRALVFLRTIAATEESPAARQLCFNFDIGLSNAARLPALAVLVHRFCEDLRRSKVSPSRLNLETSQAFQVAADAAGETLLISHDPLDDSDTTSTGADAAARHDFETPTEPGFLRITQRGEPLLTAALQFGDTREADLSDCGADSTLYAARGATIERHTREDHWWRIWVLALLVVLLVSWHSARGKSQEPLSTGQPQAHP
jgi:hypothetical protein